MLLTWCQVLHASLFRLLAFPTLWDIGQLQDPLPHRYHCITPWAVNEAGGGGGVFSRHGVNITGRKLRCM